MSSRCATASARSTAARLTLSTPCSRPMAGWSPGSRSAKPASTPSPATPRPASTGRRQPHSSPIATTSRRGRRIAAQLPMARRSSRWATTATSGRSTSAPAYTPTTPTMASPAMPASPARVRKCPSTTRRPGTRPPASCTSSTRSGVRRCSWTAITRFSSSSSHPAASRSAYAT